MTNHFLNRLFRTKISIRSDDDENSNPLKRCLTALDLTLLGVGAIIGAGIFVLAGVAAATRAGPAIAVSYVIAGIACTFTALSYAELAASLGGCGSAYGYAYAALGECIAWIIGWDLILEYAVSVSTVSVGWSHYVNNILQAFGWSIPTRFLEGPFSGGILNLPACLAVLGITFLLLQGAKIGARANAVMVAVKFSVIILFIILAIPHFDMKNWLPFMPFGVDGIVRGAGLIFFAYIGFDAVSTAAEEVINPQRNLPIGIISSLVICTVLYIIVSCLLTGMVPYTALNVGSPISLALFKVGHHIAAAFIAVGAVAGLTTVMLVMYYGLSRVVFAMARDGLMPSIFSIVSPRARVPQYTIIFSGLLMAVLSALFPIEALAELVNIGTLSAFVIVCSGVIVLRYRQPDMPRPFKTPFSPWIPLMGVISCAYLISSLPYNAFIRFGIWMAIGIVMYFVYGFRSSYLSREQG